MILGGSWRSYIAAEAIENEAIILILKVLPRHAPELCYINQGYHIKIKSQTFKFRES